MEHAGIQLEQATFAGGCFWCVQGPFDVEPGVSHVMVGYTGGSKEDAEYYTVASGKTKHRESVHMEFDPTKVTYRRLVELFFKQIDPTDPGGQFGDRGFQYMTAVYYHTDAQRKIVEEYIKELNALGRFEYPIATEVVPFTTFFPAEEDHQAYYKKNPLRYKLYKQGSGRTAYIEKNGQD